MSVIDYFENLNDIYGPLELKLDQNDHREN